MKLCCRIVIALILCWYVISSVALAQLIAPNEPLPDCKFDSKLKERIPVAIDTALAALAKSQLNDGSFPSSSLGQPGVTCLAIMAFLSRGHQPNVGPYGGNLHRAIDYVLAQQTKSGFICTTAKESENNEGVEIDSFSPTYNHAISMLMLGEVYGTTVSPQTERVRRTIQQGLAFTVKLWDIRKKTEADDGGWRYHSFYEDDPPESDISVTAWHMTSLRSIRNAGFDVPADVPKRVSSYVTRMFDGKSGQFRYAGAHPPSPVMTAAATLTLCLCGQFDAPEILPAARVLSELEVSDYREGISAHRHWPYYMCYYTSQAAAQLGGNVWRKCNTRICTLLCRTQNRDGTWTAMGDEREFGDCYATSMAILSLTTQYQLLPIYQN